MQKIVVNRCWGGYGLSQEAYAKLIEWGIPVRGFTLEDDARDEVVIFDNQQTEERLRVGPERYFECWSDEEEHRTHPLVVRVVEELGEEADGHYARLKVVEVPDGVEWKISEYDGRESVHEKHRSW